MEPLKIMLRRRSASSRNQTAEDALVLNADDDVASRAAARAKSRVFWFSRTRVVRQGAFVHEGAIVLPRIGAGRARVHPQSCRDPAQRPAQCRECAGCGLRCRGSPGVEAEAIRTAVEDFRAVEHRLEFVANVNGVDYYNDSKATNVDAAMKAIAAFPVGIHLILGGKDKNSDYRLMRPLHSGARQGRLHHRRGGGEDHHPRRRRGAHRQRRHAGCGGHQSSRSRAAGRDCSAGAGLLQLRPV